VPFFESATAGGGDFAVCYTADVTWTMTDTGDEVRGPSSVRDYIVGLHTCVPGARAESRFVGRR
jgi:hypothetical protein